MRRVKMSTRDGSFPSSGRLLPRLSGSPRRDSAQTMIDSTPMTADLPAARLWSETLQLRSNSVRRQSDPGPGPTRPDPTPAGPDCMAPKHVAGFVAGRRTTLQRGRRRRPTGAVPTARRAPSPPPRAKLTLRRLFSHRRFRPPAQNASNSCV